MSTCLYVEWYKCLVVLLVVLLFDWEGPFGQRWEYREEEVSAHENQLLLMQRKRSRIASRMKSPIHVSFISNPIPGKLQTLSSSLYVRKQTAFFPAFWVVSTIGWVADSDQRGTWFESHSLRFNNLFHTVCVLRDALVERFRVEP